MVSFSFSTLANAQSTIDVLHAEKYIEVPKDLKKEKRTPVKIITRKDSSEPPLFTECTINYDDYNNRIFISEYTKSRIIIFDEDLNYVGELRPGWYDFPIGIDFDKNGRFVVSDNRSAQLFDKDSNFLNEYELYGITNSPALFDSRNNIVIYSVEDTTLFTVYDTNGEKISRFGEPLGFRDPKARGQPWNYLYNGLHYVIDDEGYLFCAFRDHPIMRKYDPKGNLVLEADYFNIPGVSDRLKDWQKEWGREKGKSDTYYSVKGFVTSLSVDKNYLYARFFGYNKPVYVFDKENFKLVKKYELFGTRQERLARIFDASSKDYIYAITARGNLVRYDK